MMDNRVPSSAKLFLVLVLFSPTMEKILWASAFEWGSTNTTNAAILEMPPKLAQNSHLWKKEPRAPITQMLCFYDFN